MQRIIDIAIAQFAAAGWELVKHGIQGADATFHKMYETIVGPQRASVCLYFSTGHAVLQGYYYSEGRNVLAPNMMLVPETATGVVMTVETTKFLRQAEKAINESYARSLHLATAAA